MSSATASVVELKNILKSFGITAANYNKSKLRELAESAIKVGLEALPDDDHEESVEKRRRVERDGVVVKVCPVNKVGNWTDNLSTLPEVAFGDIFVYLRSSCGWSDERLKRYKADNGYQLHICRHISGVKMHNTGKGLVYVRGECLPQTRQSEKSYDVWVLLATTGEIESAGCTCVAADQGSCKHAIALLFSIQSFVERQQDSSLEVGTDVTCKWSQPRKTSKPQETINISYTVEGRQHRTEPLPGTYKPIGQNVRMTDREVESALYVLCKESAPQCLQLHVLRSSDQDETIDTDQDATVAPKPRTVAEIVQVFNASGSSDFEEFVAESISQADRDAIADLPQGSDEWMEQRKWRVTASMAKTVFSFRLNNKAENSLVKQVSGMSQFSSASIRYGLANEGPARQKYLTKQSAIHLNLKINLCGLIVDKTCPFLGASPDGLVSCDCCGEGLVEIKCTHKYQNLTPEGVAMQAKYHCYLDTDGKVRLNHASAWFFQIQMQLGVTEMPYCDFVLFTNKDISVERILFDPGMWSKVKDKSMVFYRKFIIPKLFQ